MDGFKNFKKLDDDLQRVIEKEETSSSMTSESDETKHAMMDHRQHLKHLLHTNKFQISVVILVILDCIIVIAELLIDLKVFETGGEESIHESLAPHILHYISIAILSIFLVELGIKIYAFRLEFFKSKMEVFDGIVVVLSFALDIAFANEEGIISGLGLFIVLRLWRVTRILNGIVISVKVQAEKKLARERCSRQAVEQELSKFREYCSAQEREIEILQGLLKKHGIEFQKMEKPVVINKIDVVAEVNEFIEKTNNENFSSA
ncbi:voltage-gated hydrogen channel 1-like [Lineus longissimus]|uniref:voltage-gated hydrogen channel 1-like n=1 Tax=Lineus longissimus TaxID=88925 RepID=UPI002B4CA97A